MDYLTTYWCSLSKVLVRCFFRFVFVLVSLLHRSSYNASKQWSYVSFCHYGTKCILSASTNKVSGWNYSEQTKSSLHVNMSLCCLCVNCLVCKKWHSCICYFLPRWQSLWCTTTSTQLVKTNSYFRTIQNSMHILGTDAFVSATDKTVMVHWWWKQWKGLEHLAWFARMFSGHGHWVTFCWQVLSRCLNSSCPTIPPCLQSETPLFFCKLCFDKMQVALRCFNGLFVVFHWGCKRLTDCESPRFVLCYHSLCCVTVYYVRRFFDFFFFSLFSVWSKRYLWYRLVTSTFGFLIHWLCYQAFALCSWVLWRYVLQCMYARCIAVVFIQDGCCEGLVMHPGHSPVSCLSAVYFLLSEFHFESALFCFLFVFSQQRIF